VLTGWVTEKQTHDTKCFPFVDLGDVNQIDIDEKRQCPDLSEGSSQS